MSVVMYAWGMVTHVYNIQCFVGGHCGRRCLGVASCLRAYVAMYAWDVVTGVCVCVAFGVVVGGRLLGAYVLSVVMYAWGMVSGVYNIPCFVGGMVDDGVWGWHPVCGHVWPSMLGKL